MASMVLAMQGTMGAGCEDFTPRCEEVNHSWVSGTSVAFLCLEDKQSHVVGCSILNGVFPNSNLQSLFLISYLFVEFVSRCFSYSWLMTITFGVIRLHINL